MSSTGAARPSAPKFSSFKPKPEPSTPPAPEDKTEKPREASRHGHGRATGDTRPRSPHRHASSAGRPGGPAGRDSRDRPEGSGRRLDLSRRPTSSKHSGDDIFVIDTRGDTLIRRYGSNSRYDVPRYRRFGSGRLLGTDDFFSVVQGGTRDEFVLRGLGEGGSALSHDMKSLLAKAGRRSSELVRIRTDKSQTFTGTEDFLALKSSSRKRKRRYSQSDESAGEDGPSYKSIHGMSRKHEHSDSDEAYGIDASMDSDQPDLHDPIQVRNVELSRKVRDQPQDIEAWMELVDQQDMLLSAGEHQGRRPTPAEIKSYAHIKLSMLERALAHAKTPEQIERLRLRRMAEGAKIWGPKTTAQRWEELLRDYGASFEIWKAYMNFRQTNLQTFRYDDIKQIYISRIRGIEKEAMGLNTGLGRQSRYDQLVAVFLRATRFIADAGYSELATAAWQATLELNFYRPTSLTSAPPNSALSSFQNFWESEVPRIGDESAKGWAYFEATGGVDEAPEPKSAAQDILPSTRDGYKAWASVEMQRAMKAKVPARTMDDGTEDDPYRVVMYADIQELLTYIPTEDLSMIRERLVDAFLIFCQLPPVFGICSALRLTLQDGITGYGTTIPFDLDNAQKSRDLPCQHTAGDPIKPPEFTHQYQKMGKSTDVLFPSGHWFRYMNPIRETVQPDQYRLVSRTLKQLASSLGNEELDVYYLSFDNLNNTDSSKKTAKALLKRNPTNAELYIGFANSEFTKGNKDAARHVISAALGLPTMPLYDRLRLCIAWAWMEMEDKQLAQALLRLCSVPEDGTTDESASPARILQTRQMLSRNRDHLISSDDPDGALIFAEGMALLEYMTKNSGKESQSTSQGDIWSAIATVSSCSEDLVSRGLAESSAHEKLLQFASRLLYYHASHGPYRPAFFREHHGRYVELFPDNTIFLSVYAWREERLSVDDRVRTLFDRTVLSKAHDRPSSRVFAIRHEMATGNVHSTRAAFERAVDASGDDSAAASGACSSRHHTGIWISYIRHCHGSPALRSRAKDVFYRAVQRCPWSKDVFLQAFATLVHDMDSTELRSVYNMLCDKGLRVHVELGEFVEQWKERAEQRRVE